MQGAAPSPGAGPGVVARLGMAITAPRWALAVADLPAHAGRSGTDLIRMLGALLLSVHTRRIVAAVWLATAVGFMAGLRGVAAVLSQALTVDLAFLVVATLAMWLGAGPRRSLGRAFDQVCVAALPMVSLEIVATAVTRGLDVAVPRAVTLGLTGLAFGWAGALVALGWRQVRQVQPRQVQVPPAVIARGRRAGAAILVLAVAGLAINTVWVVRNADLLRPMTPGDPAPQFVLPEVGPDGALGAAVALESTRGKVVVVDFWATWCGPCLEAMPALARLRGALGADGEVLAINLDDPRKAREVIDRLAPGMRVLFDHSGGTATRYGVGPIPHTVVIDRGGRVRAVLRGGEGGDLAAAVAAARASP
jgi:thiol-disulfide isomerase/thioredoxin